MKFYFIQLLSKNQHLQLWLHFLLFFDGILLRPLLFSSCFPVSASDRADLSQIKDNTVSEWVHSSRCSVMLSSSDSPLSPECRHTPHEPSWREGLSLLHYVRRTEDWIQKEGCTSQNRAAAGVCVHCKTSSVGGDVCTGQCYCGGEHFQKRNVFLWSVWQ